MCSRTTCGPRCQGKSQGICVRTSLTDLARSKSYKCPQALKHLLERCWHKDPAQRPSCVEMVDAFERKILLQCAIHDKLMQQVWVEHVCKGSVEGGLTREVSVERVLTCALC